MNGEKSFVKRRIGVCGSSMGLSEHAKLFCEAVGTRLVEDPSVVIVSPGMQKRGDAANEQDLAAEWYIVSSAEKRLMELASKNGDYAIDDHIETVSAETNELGCVKLFQKGYIHRSRGKTFAAKRYCFVDSIDALIAVTGRLGTGEELALAYELNKGVLPVPSFNGTAREFWSAYRVELLRNLRIDHMRGRYWEAKVWETNVDDKTVNDNTSEQELRNLADDMVSALLDSLPRRCFVITPFNDEFSALYDFVIALAVEDVGDQPVRLDRAAIPGDVGKQINEGIKTCDYAIAVLDGFSPNVLYELGLTHGLGKRAILLNRKGALDGEIPIPFDLTMQQRLEYQTIDEQLRVRLQKAITSLGGRHHTAERKQTMITALEKQPR